jgi:hypothetical protein
MLPLLEYFPKYPYQSSSHLDHIDASNNKLSYWDKASNSIESIIPFPTIYIVHVVLIMSDTLIFRYLFRFLYLLGQLGYKDHMDHHCMLIKWLL